MPGLIKFISIHFWNLVLSVIDNGTGCTQFIHSVHTASLISGMRGLCSHHLRNKVK